MPTGSISYSDLNTLEFLSGEAQPKSLSTCVLQSVLLYRFEFVCIKCEFVFIPHYKRPGSHRVSSSAERRPWTYPSLQFQSSSGTSGSRVTVTSCLRKLCFSFLSCAACFFSERLFTFVDNIHTKAYTLVFVLHFYFLIVSVCVKPCAMVPRWRSEDNSPTLWVPGLEHKSACMAASTFTH